MHKRITFLSNFGTGLKPSMVGSWSASRSFLLEPAGPSFGLHPRSLSLVLSLPSFQASVEVYFHRLPWSLESFFLDCGQLKCSIHTQAPLQPTAYTSALYLHKPFPSLVPTQQPWTLPMEIVLVTPICAKDSLTSLTPEQRHYPINMS